MGPKHRYKSFRYKVKIMQELSNKKPYKMIWLEAERELALRGFLVHPNKPRVSRIQTDQFPVVLPYLPEKTKVPR